MSLSSQNSFKSTSIPESQKTSSRRPGKPPRVTMMWALSCDLNRVHQASTSPGPTKDMVGWGGGGRVKWVKVSRGKTSGYEIIVPGYVRYIMVTSQ